MPEKLSIVREEQNMIGAWVDKARDELESAKDVVPLYFKDVTTSLECDYIIGKLLRLLDVEKEN